MRTWLDIRLELVDRMRREQIYAQINRERRLRGVMTPDTLGVMTPCDFCHEEVHTDANHYWVGADETSDCPADDRGHMVAGGKRG